MLGMLPQRALVIMPPGPRRRLSPIRLLPRRLVEFCRRRSPPRLAPAPNRREEEAVDRSQIRGYEVIVGVDVGKASNYVMALRLDEDEPLVSRAVPQEEAPVREAFAEASSHGKALVVVDQCGAFGRLAVAVARDMGLDVAHIPPRRFEQAAATYGEDKDDLLDAFIIADSARSAPRLVDPVGERGEALERIKVLSSCRDDLVEERTRCYNRLHDLVHQACPPLEALFSGHRMHNDLEIRLLARYGGPEGLRRAGRKRCERWAASLKYQRTHGPARVAEVFEALSRQTVSMPAADAIERQVKRLAARVVAINGEVGELEAEMASLSERVPEVGILRTLPGVGEVYGAAIASEIGDVSRFKDADHLATYAGLAPVRKKSGTSLNKSRRRKGGNRRLKNAMVQSAQCAVRSEAWAREYYDRKRREGKKHRQALVALARRRVEVVYAMLSSGTCYEPRTKEA